MSDKLWAIVLAGGEGSRLADTARKLYGRVLPKQFLSFGRRRTMLQATIERLLPIVPPRRMVVVVPAAHLAISREQLASHPAVEIVAQPKNVGTGPGVLLPLCHVLRRDPGARIALVPSDHDFRAPRIMLDALTQAQNAIERGSSDTVLLGATAESAARDLGWITTSGQDGTGVQRIERFVEKPPQALAEELYRRGALWNTMLLVARGATLWSLSRRHLPAQTALLESYRSEIGTEASARRLSEIYGGMPCADFSRDLIGLSEGLGALPMTGAGWSDCGTPERLASGPIPRSPPFDAEKRRRDSAGL